MPTSSVNPTVAWICGTILLVAILAGLFVLVWHGSIAGGALLGVVGTVLGIVAGIFGVHTVATAVAKARAQDTP